MLLGSIYPVLPPASIC